MSLEPGSPIGIDDRAHASTRRQVFEALAKEDLYAQGWAVGSVRKKDAYVSAQTNLPFSPIEWICFARKYLDEAELAWSNYCPDVNIINIRVLKAASLLVSCLTTSATYEDLNLIAGVSCTKFPPFTRGLQDLKDAVARGEYRPDMV